MADTQQDKQRIVKKKFNFLLAIFLNPILDFHLSKTNDVTFTMQAAYRLLLKKS